MEKPNRPKNLPVKLDYSIFARELADAAFELGKLDGLQRQLPDPSLLISPLTVKEATTSSKIEGTKSTVSDVMRYEAGELAKHPDTIEVANYRQASLWAMKKLGHRKLSLSFIKDLHGILLNQVRGHVKRGAFRDDQVFIGKDGDTIKDASYIPPEPILIQDLMDNLENYFMKGDENPLVKAGMVHYQFEAIHPFGDGNGRIGRLIIPLFLFQEQLLYQPTLYLSGYFADNRSEYIDTLHHVDVTNEYEVWIKFFLVAIKTQAKETQMLIERMNNLMFDVESKMENVKSPYAMKAVRFIFTKPIFKTSDLSAYLKTERATSNRLINKLVEFGVILPITGGSERKPLYIFRDLVKLL